MTLSQEEEEERHRTDHRGNMRQRPEPADRRGISSESDRTLARAVCLAEASRSATADDELQLIEDGRSAL